mmetsp:Transcript_52939/g.120668  ORF Transcript_52939/g.120668 Transcript_52939/m.120668 type:complete len:251 (-) Transcript_52939:516-1268(-)
MEFLAAPQGTEVGSMPPPPRRTLMCRTDHQAPLPATLPRRSASRRSPQCHPAADEQLNHAPANSHGEKYHSCRWLLQLVKYLCLKQADGSIRTLPWHRSNSWTAPRRNRPYCLGQSAKTPGSPATPAGAQQPGTWKRSNRAATTLPRSECCQPKPHNLPPRVPGYRTTPDLSSIDRSPDPRHTGSPTLPAVGLRRVSRQETSGTAMRMAAIGKGPAAPGDTHCRQCTGRQIRYCLHHIERRGVGLPKLDV